jgi:hypothetical protein
MMPASDATASDVTGRRGARARRGGGGRLLVSQRANTILLMVLFGESCYDSGALTSPYMKRADQCAGNALIGPNATKESESMSRLRYTTDSITVYANPNPSSSLFERHSSRLAVL